MSAEKRDSRYEVLRIIATIAITLNHVPCSENALIVNKFVRNFFFLGGQTGVNLFLIIGTWFLADKSFKSERVIKLIGEALFYFLFLDIIVLLLGEQFTIQSFINSFKNWFCFGYVVMLLMIPILKKFIFKSVVIIGAFTSIAITVIGYIFPDFIMVKLFLKGLFIGPVWFCYLFILISYLKRNGKFIIPRYDKCLIVFSIVYIGMYIVLNTTNNSFIREVHSPATLICALALFFCAFSLNSEYIPIVNKIATYTFAVCLIQGHQIFRAYIWEKLFHFTSMSEESLFYIPLSFISVFVMFVLAIILDNIRIIIEKRKPVKRLRELICIKIDRLYHLN